MSSDLIYILIAQQLVEYFQHYGYIGIYIFYTTVDQVAPIPEQITLIIIGYFATQGTLNPVFAGLFSITAFMTVDTVYFFLTKTGNKLFKKFTHRAQSSSATGWKKKIKDHTLKSLIVLCFIPRMRLLAPVFVSLMKFPYAKFALYDLIGLGIFTAVYVSLGIVFHKSISSLMKDAESVGNIVFIAAMVVMTILTIIIIRRNKKRDH